MDESVKDVPPRGTRDLRVDPDRHPGWTRATERTPSPGELVHTHEGSATVVRVLGRTESGGRLLELSMEDGRSAPFFAAAANVMVRVHDEGTDPSGGATP